MGRKTVVEKAIGFLKGLIVTERRKRNIERIVENVDGIDYESQQHLISESTWDTEGLLKSVASTASLQLKKLGLVGLTVDEKAHLKKGTKSAGVARQYAGSVGKVDNCQVGVYLSLNADKYATITNQRLFLPKEWTDDPSRCLEAGIPKGKAVFQTKPQLALEMIKEHIADGVHFDYINGDGLYGNNYELIKGIIALKKLYVLEVHNNQRIYLEKPQISVPQKETGKRGPTPKHLKPDIEGIKVSDYVKGLRKEEFTEVKIRKTTKGWLKALVHIKEVWVWDENNGDTQAFCQTLVVRKPLKKGDKEKYSLSNIAPGAQPIEIFAFMQAQRFWIEKCFRDNSHDLGMSDYQVRKWKGWHNHMAMTFLVMLFIMEQRLKYQDEMPLLSYGDVRELLIDMFVNRTKNFDKKIKQMEKRHIQRAKETKRHYKKNTELII